MSLNNNYNCNLSSGNDDSNQDPVEEVEYWIIHGNFIVPNENTKSVEIKEDYVLKCSTLVGVIQYFGPASTSVSKNIVKGEEGESVIELSKYEFLVPGFIDLHIHAPQYSYSGTATDRPLMEWLDEYTFPAERSLNEDLQMASEVYQRVVDATLRNGTTTALYFATLHVEPTKVLCDVIQNRGQRGLVGKVCMDRNSPEDYCQTIEENLKGTQEIIDYIRSSEAGKNGLLLPVVTPRFYPTCTFELLSKLGEIAVNNDCHIQSHISESIDEVEFSRILDESEVGGRDDDEEVTSRSDTQIFEAANCLTNKTILAHGVFVDEKDAALLRARGCAIAHCALSNFYFAGHPLRCQHLMCLGNNIGLGTDVAGGYSPSMMNACRNTVIASRALWQAQYYRDKNSPKDECLDYKQAFYLATLVSLKS